MVLIHGNIVMYVEIFLPLFILLRTQRKNKHYDLNIYSTRLEQL